DPIRRLASILSADAEATMIGKRLKLSTQESLRLEVMLAADPVIDVTGGAKAWRGQIYGLGGNLYAARLLLSTGASACWRASLARARDRPPPALPVSGGHSLKVCLMSGRKVGALTEAVERWRFDGENADERAPCRGELETRVRASRFG